MIKFKNFLIEEPQILCEESTKFSTHMETVIGVCYDAAIANDGKNILEKALKQTEFKTAKKYWQRKSQDESVVALMKFGKKISAQIKTKGKFDTQEQGKLTYQWTEWTKFGSKDKGKRGSDTSKTDIVLGNKRCSVKNASGAQLMSGKKGESKATVEAAAETLKLKENATAKLIGLMENLQAHTTEGYYASMDLLKKFKESNPGGNVTMYEWAKKVVDKWDTVNDKYEALKKENPRTKDPKIKKRLADYKEKLDNLEKPTAEIRKVADNPDKNKIAQTYIKDEQAKFMKDVEGKFQRNQKNVKKELTGLFNNVDFKNAFVYEAASGAKKFGNVVQKADYMLSWMKKESIEDFIIKVNPIKNSSSPTIKKYAEQIDLQVNWKSSSTSNHKGYSVYQNVRLGLGKLFKESQQIYENYSKQCGIYQDYLNENAITEGAFFDRIKELANKFMSVAKESWNKFVSFIKEAVSKIKEFAEDGISALGNMFGFEMDVRDSLLNNGNLKLKI
jgi:hypothetical protein